MVDRIVVDKILVGFEAQILVSSKLTVWAGKGAGRGVPAKARRTGTERPAERVAR